MNNYFNRLGTKVFIVIVLLSIVPIFSLYSYYSNFIKNSEVDFAKKDLVRIGNIVSVSSYSNHRFQIDRRYIKGIEASGDYSISIVNDYGETVYSTNDKFSRLTIGSREILGILAGKKTQYTIISDDKITVYIAVMDGKTPTGVVIISGYYNEQKKQSADKTIVNIIIISIVFVAVLAYLFAKYINIPITKLISSLKRIVNGHIDEKVDVVGSYEVREISKAVNDMRERINFIESSRQQFVANVSHELKTPLSSIKVLADTLLSQKDASKEMYDEFLSDISEEIDRENKIINDLLTMVTLDNKDEMNRELVLINDIVENVTRMLLPIAKKRNITFEIKSYRKVEAYVDETKFYLVLTNLIENAIKYNIEGGKVTIVINADFRDFTIKVIDTGIGIPEESINKIFDRFYRVDKMRSRDSGGTGLGLNIVQRVVLLHKGKIKCHSEEGVGTTFELTIPLSKW